LKRFEKSLEHATAIAAISEADKNYFSSKYGKTFLMRPCHPSAQVLAQKGSGEYILYHAILVPLKISILHFSSFRILYQG
jgi:hypothetical protein